MGIWLNQFINLGLVNDPLVNNGELSLGVKFGVVSAGVHTLESFTLAVEVRIMLSVALNIYKGY